MSDIDVTLRLPETLVEKARAQGLLDSDRLARLLAAEIERGEVWASLDRTLEPARAAFRADHPNMSEDEITALMNEIIDEARAEENTESSAS